MVQATRILGIDPGSRLTGYGVIDLVGHQMRPVTHGTLRLSNTGGKAVIPLEQRLHLIYLGLTEVILKYKPHVMSVERVFFAKNAVSALKLGQARGAVILTGAIHGLEIVEYSPSEVKAAVVGHGQADKEQVAKMVQILTGAKDFDTSDASDGMALALCHAQMIASQNRGSDAYRTAYKAAGGRSTNRRFSLAESVGITAEMVQQGKLKK